MGLIVPVAGQNEAAVPSDVQRSINLMKAAGFDGDVEYRKERVQFPGGDYLYESVTFQSWNGVRETYDANLLAKYPAITITEAGRIGLLAPRPEGQPAVKPRVEEPAVQVAPGNTMFGGGAR